MEMTSNCDATNSAHQMQMTTLWPWTKTPPMKIFCVRHWLATHRFTLLVKSLQWNRNIRCSSSSRQIHTLCELFGAAFLLMWCGNGVTTPLYLALHPYTWPLQPIVFKWRQNSPSTGFASWSRIDSTWMRCATLDKAPNPPNLNIKHYKTSGFC